MSQPNSPTPPPFPRSENRTSTESIDNTQPGSSKSYAYGSQLNSNLFQSSKSTQNQAPNTQTQQMTPTHDREIQNQVLLELCDQEYDYIPEETKMNLVEEILIENESQFIQSQLTVGDYVRMVVEKYRQIRKREKYNLLKRGINSRESYSRIIRNKKDSKSTINSTMNN